MALSSEPIETRPESYECFPAATSGRLGLTIVVGLLKVHVHDAARPDLGHLVAVQSLHFLEAAGLYLVATVLGEESRDAVGRKFLRAFLIPRIFVGRVAAPRINIVAPEIDTLFSWAAVEIVSQNGASLIVIRGIADTHWSVLPLLDVCFRVPDCGLDKSAGDSVVWRIGDLVSSKEAKCVCVVGQTVNHSCVPSVKRGIPLRFIAVNGGFRLAKISDHVYPSICEHLHAFGMVSGRVDSVCSDGICLKLL